MTIETWLAFATLFLTAAGGLWTGFWKLNKGMQEQFMKLTASQTANYHAIDLRLTSIETTVSPYAQHISVLQTQQRDSVVSLTKMMGKVDSMETAILKLDRQVEDLQKRK